MFVSCFFFLLSQPTQTPASPANTLDPSQGLQPPTELFAPFNPASVPSGKTLLVFLLKYSTATSRAGNKRSGWRGERVDSEARQEEKEGGVVLR